MRRVRLSGPRDRLAGRTGHHGRVLRWCGRAVDERRRQRGKQAMAELHVGRFRAAIVLLPLARRRRLRQFAPRLVRVLVVRRLLRLAQFFIYRDSYLPNMQVATGCSRRMARRKSLAPFLRLNTVWDGMADSLFHGSSATWLDGIKVSGLDRIVELQSTDTPVILIVPHLGLSALILAQLLPTRGIRCIVDNLAPRIFEQVSAVEVFDADSPYRGFLALQQGKVLIFGGDTPGPGLPCRFLDRFVSFPMLIARMAARTGAAVATAYCYEATPGSWHAVFDEPFFVADRSAETVTADLAARLERIIRAHPFEWVAYRPFLSHVSFPRTGQLPVLVGVGGGADITVRETYQRRLRAYAGMVVEAADVSGLDLAGLVARLRAGGHELLLLVHPNLGDELGELPLLIVWFFRLDTDWVAYDPPDQAAPAAAREGLTAFSLSLVKTVVLEALLVRGVTRLDAAALRQADRAGFRCYHLPSEARLRAELERLDARGVELPDAIL